MKSSATLPYRLLILTVLLLLLIPVLSVPTSSAAPMADEIPPAMIADLVATSGVTAGTVDLTWTAPGDDGATGTAAVYIIRHNT